jgi:hypothetical protein
MRSESLSKKLGMITAGEEFDSQLGLFNCVFMSCNRRSKNAINFFLDYFVQKIK